MTPQELERFIGRRNVFAIQTEAGSYVPIRRLITQKDLEEHLKGEKTLGAYAIREDNKVTFGIIDIDFTKDDLATSEAIGKELMTLFPDFDRCLEFSGRRGHHVWIFPKQLETPKFIRELIKTRLRAKGLQNIEVYPKQDSVTDSEKGLGNLIKLPCGKHKLGGWSAVLEWKKEGEL